MNSFLLITKRESMADHAWDFCKNQGIEDIDITVVDAVSDKSQKSSEKGIALIRKIINSISLKPIRRDKKAVVVLNSDKLSIPGQNALLKTLEEPPSDTIIVLTVENEYSILPTIHSRCLIIKDSKEEDRALKEENDMENLSYLEKAEALSKDKDKALSFLEQEIKYLEKKMMGAVEKNPRDKSAFETRAALSSYLRTYDLIKTTNTNLRLALENLFLTESA